VGVGWDFGSAFCVSVALPRTWQSPKPRFAFGVVLAAVILADGLRKLHQRHFRI
jgi:hypothetical protein